MSKITFRADDELITQLEEFEDSKSEIMRQALREYLETHGDGGVQTEPSSETSESDTESLDELVADRVDALIADRLDNAFRPTQPQDINVNVSLEGQTSDLVDSEQQSVTTDSGQSSGPSNDASHNPGTDKSVAANEELTRAQTGTNCSQCGENVDPSHVHCPNCGEKTSHRVFCDCGDEIRSDWAFCPSCGRRTPAADVLDNS